ncbi:TRAM domain-containing protein [Deefgea sp. CFH1-16]|uniref:TRAM domain-containing protein n=1 Tax=Deefgea sp. CFH1-16 TaxID=2675457 RepID=UPI001FFDDE69|nr:TRAM domain-containing protein [Deefgea sp. CFH1-16]
MNPSAPKTNPTATVESLDHEGHGVARYEGKTIFIDGGLPFETITFSSYRKKPSFENAQAITIHNDSFMRVKPKCPHFGVCGGCSMQHMEFGAQVAAKQRILEDQFTPYWQGQRRIDAARHLWSSLGLSLTRPTLSPLCGKKRTSLSWLS